MDKKKGLYKKRLFLDMYFGLFLEILKARDRILTPFGSCLAANMYTPRKTINWPTEQKIFCSCPYKKKGLMSTAHTIDCKVLSDHREVWENGA